MKTAKLTLSHGHTNLDSIATTSATAITTALNSTRSRSQFKKLEHERDALREQVLNLAEENYAREPEFVRNRLRLREQSDELARMVKRLQAKYMEPIVVKLNKLEAKLAQEAREYEEASERMAHEFLERTTNETHQPSSDTAVTTYERFLADYIDLRKKTSRKRILVDRLAKERDQLMSNLTFKTLVSSTSKLPLFANRLGNEQAGVACSDSTSFNSSDSSMTMPPASPSLSSSSSSPPQPPSQLEKPPQAPSSLSSSSTATNSSFSSELQLKSSKSCRISLPSATVEQPHESPKPTPRQRKRVSFIK